MHANTGGGAYIIYMCFYTIGGTEPYIYAFNTNRGEILGYICEYISGGETHIYTPLTLSEAEITAAL